MLSYGVPMKRFLFAPLFAFLPALAVAADLPQDQVKFFETSVRPLLAGSCVKCHSQSAGKTKGGLALDSRAGWQKGGETGPALVPGDPDASLLIKAIRYADPDTAMPPSSAGGQLKPEDIKILEKWVAMGAPDPRNAATPAKDIAKIAGGLTEEMKDKTKEHWAYQPVTSPPVPTVKDAAWVKTPVDNFVLAQLESKGMKPSATADKRTLIRRATFDLTGLPPSPQEVLEFVKDETPQAFEKVVDRLLASPQYGERWGRYWLDVARYADTRGDVKKQTSPLSPFAWTYRDYVIKALNSDRPYDQFIREQIAADQLPTAQTQPGTLAALGFLTEGDQFEGNKNDIINDQIDVVTKGFLATTVTCARCHDHFFDPVPTRDYYSLHGIFNSCTEPDELPVIGASPDQKANAQYKTERQDLVNKGYALLDRELNQLASKFNNHPEAFLLAMNKSRGGKKLANDPETLAELKKNNLLPEDIQAGVRSIQMQIRAAAEKRQQQMNNPSPAKTTSVAKEDNKSKKREMRQAAKNFDHPVLGIWNDLMKLTDANFATGSAEIIARLSNPEQSKNVNSLVVAAFKNQKLASMDQAANIYAGLFSKAQEAFKKEHEDWKKSAPEHTVYPGLKDVALEEVRSAVFSVKPYLGKPFEDIQQTLTQDLQRVMVRIINEITALDLASPGSLARANVVTDSKVKNSSVFIRGEAKTLGPEVPRQFLEFIQPERKPFPAAVSGRKELADAIASKDNPLTSRVMVNRVWLHHFGEGFVSTPDDLGVMSEAPSNKDLCNWLAAKFMNDGWSLKKLHKLIMTSAVYQQSSDPNEQMAKLDPFNRLLWRANVRRLDFEALRDSLLSIGGKLDLTMYGHPVNIESEPYSPRRTIYGFVDRLNMAEFMKNFDMANAQLPTGRRHETIVPQQALFRMNSLLVIEQARNIIDRPEFQKAMNDNERVKTLYEIIYQRWPKPEEVKLAMSFVHGQADNAAPESAPVSLDEMVKNPKIKALLDADPKKLTKKEKERREQIEQRLARDKAVKGNKKGGGNLNELVSDPNAEKVDRSALDSWEKFAHALLMTNEVCYLN